MNRVRRESCPSFTAHWGPFWVGPLTVAQSQEGSDATQGLRPLPVNRRALIPGRRPRPKQSLTFRQLDYSPTPNRLNRGVKRSATSWPVSIDS
jgi:hypothetical protein